MEEGHLQIPEYTPISCQIIINGSDADASREREMKKTGSEAGSCTSSVINATHARMTLRAFIYSYEKPSL